ncbi:MAG TPA: hypothetical protein PK629_02930 [Oscillospiraceae bacterium]|nr:hypothetical protein [Oscillospiraceae bacterium]HPF56630.1 hypothetical protein [Clostridiales bacterium]HPK34280.1 hypothetical protein [Oscillospiraceae bacterium]HPR74817.1 hypothetical protein [Oscillospiraceae bacterium]
MKDRTILESMELCGQCHLAWLDPEKEYMPFGGWEAAHDTGRWWDAMLRLEDASGFKIPEFAETAMLKNIQLMTDNPVGILLNPPGRPWLKTKFNGHNFRETILALTALVQFRNNDWAKKKALQLIQSVEEFLPDDTRLDILGIAQKANLPLGSDPNILPSDSPWFNNTGSTGRALEGFVWFYEITGEASALRLAERLAKLNLRTMVNADGSPREEMFSVKNNGHNHSYLGTLRGLVRYGRLTGKTEYIKAVEATYRHTLWKNNATYSGYTPHDLGYPRFNNKFGEPLGEHGSCSDMMQLALWLSEEKGNSDMLDDLERLIRARVLPAQVIDHDNPKRNGAWGVYDYPYDFGVTPDVYSAVLHSLADVYKNIAKKDGDIVTIQLNFDIDTPFVNVKTKTGDVREITVTPKIDCGLRIRIPCWAPRESVVSSSGKLTWDGDYLIFPKGKEPVTVKYKPPTYQTEEIMKGSGRKFILQWRGDEVVSCSPAAPIYPEKE